ncbi:YegP family protein [Arthrobacter sp. NA-172]|uniref:YegP family protein n=1 Tax=Arthrobacter sp. NA-172 TaxID=3367524 RepID=UPI00375450D1
MAGIFELFVEAEARYRFRLRTPDGTVMAVSKGFDIKPAAAPGIRDVRAYAGMGLIADLGRKSPGHSDERS